MKVLLTCPPMIGLFQEIKPLFDAKSIEVYIPDFSQTMTEKDLISLIPNFSGWIIGDDPATKSVFSAGKSGKLKAAVKWGVGTDNVDFQACHDLSIPITNTPGVFGREVADVAIAYLLGLARGTYQIDREIRLNNTWPKPCGISLWNKKAAIIGFGDIGKQIAKRLQAFDVEVYVSDPKHLSIVLPYSARPLCWQTELHMIDFLFFAAPLTSETYHMLNSSTLNKLKKGVRIVNVSRGPIIEESALIKGLKDGTIHSAALDVFEEEPLNLNSELRMYPKCIFGSHNASNTEDAVRHVSNLASQKLFEFLKV